MELRVSEILNTTMQLWEQGYGGNGSQLHHTPWAILWTTKYANNRPPEDLIRLMSTEKGSLIWNIARQHSTMIQKHCFWEIRWQQCSFLG